MQNLILLFCLNNGSEFSTCLEFVVKNKSLVTEQRVPTDHGKVRREPGLTLRRTQQVYGTPQASGPVPLQKWYWLTPQSLYSSPPQHENWKTRDSKAGSSQDVKQRQAQVQTKLQLLQCDSHLSSLTITPTQRGMSYLDMRVCWVSDNRLKANISMYLTEKIQYSVQCVEIFPTPRGTPLPLVIAWLKLHAAERKNKYQLQDETQDLLPSASMEVMETQQVSPRRKRLQAVRIVGERLDYVLSSWSKVTVNTHYSKFVFEFKFKGIEPSQRSPQWSWSDVSFAVFYSDKTCVSKSEHMRHFQNTHLQHSSIINFFSW